MAWRVDVHRNQPSIDFDPRGRVAPIARVVPGYTTCFAARGTTASSDAFRGSRSHADIAVSNNSNKKKQHDSDLGGVSRRRRRLAVL
jgi:hypothetical protein